MTPDDIAGFYAKRADLNLADYIELDFEFECAGDPREAAAHLCSEQSTAQWHRVGIDEDFRPRFAAKVLELSAEPRPSGFSIDVTCAATGPVHAVRVTIAHPHGNFGPKLPNLLSAVCGEGVYLRARHSLDPAAGYPLSGQLLGRLPGPAIRHQRAAATIAGIRPADLLRRDQAEYRAVGRAVRRARLSELVGRPRHRQGRRDAGRRRLVSAGRARRGAGRRAAPRRAGNRRAENVSGQHHRRGRPADPAARSGGRQRRQCAAWSMPCRSGCQACGCCASTPPCR